MSGKGGFVSRVTLVARGDHDVSLRVVGVVGVVLGLVKLSLLCWAFPRLEI